MNIRFWDSQAGRLIRWTLYVPLGLLALKAVQVGSILALTWLFRDVRGLVIIGFLFGGFGFIVMAGGIFYFVALLIAKICPNPKLGMVIFGVLYYLSEGLAAIHSILNHDGSTMGVILSAILLSGALLATVIYITWNEPETIRRQQID